MNSEEFDEFDLIVARPSTAEEMLLAIGAKEDDPRIEIMLTTELVADLCVRLIRLEDTEGREDD